MGTIRNLKVKKEELSEFKEELSYFSTKPTKWGTALGTFQMVTTTRFLNEEITSYSVEIYQKRKKQESLEEKDN